MSRTPLFSISGAAILNGVALCVWTDQHKVRIINAHSISVHLFFLSQSSIRKGTAEFAIPSGTTAILNLHTYNWVLDFNEKTIMNEANTSVLQREALSSTKHFV